VKVKWIERETLTLLNRSFRCHKSDAIRNDCKQKSKVASESLIFDPVRFMERRRSNVWENFSSK